MKKGFTMIELIFVIVILGILASVAIPRLAATREDAEISAAVANLRTLVNDATAYYTVKGEFGTNTKWSEITNVPLKDAATTNVINTGAKLKAGGGDCISFQMFEKDGDKPAHIVITKEGAVNNVCTQVQNSEPLKAYFTSSVTGVNTNNNQGAIAIGSNTSVYPPK
ncbi:MAG: type II secretion system GspH family protein [Campylobacter sp.]|uniref:type II secretion system protein n=1 Tax=Campylobacter sp. TaxID=205 RepID=UPI002AA962C1|nr:type II secretion system protein [Campylobacter sp.]MCI6177319.1 type II secretion system GspH family protein [Campylobacter sp.]MCI7501000.1 type II secretion system GspH family protein [Campylobacter sp.]